MITELEPRHFPRALPIFQELTYNLVIESVIAGNTRGRIWVDHPARPTVALLWNQMDALLLAGDPGNQPFYRAFRQLLDHTLIPDAQSRGIPGFSLHYAENWEPHLPTLLADLSTQKEARLAFTLDQARLDWRAQLGPDLTMSRIDQTLLADRRLENRPQLLGWIHSFWPKLPGFLERGLGYGLLQGPRTLVSWCLSVFVAGRRCELGLETAPPYRGRSYATLTAAACVDACLDQGLQPLWHCFAHHHASCRVAHKVGFQVSQEYEVYHIPFPSR